MHITDLADHRYFRHIVDSLLNHPFEDELIALHGAILVSGNKILATEINKPKRHGLVATYAPHDRMTIHAEVGTILTARRKHDLVGATIFVARAKKTTGEIGLSKPCPTCEIILKRYGIRHCYFTSESGMINHLDFKRNNDAKERSALFGFNLART